MPVTNSIKLNLLGDLAQPLRTIAYKARPKVSDITHFCVRVLPTFVMENVYVIRVLKVDLKSYLIGSTPRKSSKVE